RRPGARAWAGSGRRSASPATSAPRPGIHRRGFALAARRGPRGAPGAAHGTRPVSETGYRHRSATAMAVSDTGGAVALYRTMYLLRRVGGRAGGPPPPPGMHGPPRRGGRGGGRAPGGGGGPAAPPRVGPRPPRRAAP